MPWAERVLALPLSWAPAHGIDKRNFARLRKRLRKGKVVRGYRGGLLQRVQEVLSNEPRPFERKVHGQSEARISS